MGCRQSFYEACKKGDIKVVHNIINKGYLKVSDWNSGLNGACEGGYIDIVKLIIDKGSYMLQKKDWNNGLYYACYGGSEGLAHTMNIINLLIEKGADDWNSGLDGACKGSRDNINIVKLMIDKGASNISEKYVYPRDKYIIAKLLSLGVSMDKLKYINGITSLYKLCKDGNIIMILYAINRGYNKHNTGHLFDVVRPYGFKANDWNGGLYGACEGGHMNIVNLMIEKGANYWNHGLYGACHGGHMNIVNLMIEKGANYWTNGLTNACRGGHINIVKLMIEKGANNWNNGLCGACEGGHIDIVNLMIEKGANNWNGGFTNACKGSRKPTHTLTSVYINIAKLMMEKGANDWEPGYYVNRIHNSDIIKLMIDVNSTQINKYLVYPRHHTRIIKLLEIGLSTDKLKDIEGIDILTTNINNFKKVTYIELYQYMPKELANMIAGYCLL